MEKYLGQRYVEQQREQHSHDHHGSESFEHISSHREEDECNQSGADITIPDRRPASVFGIIDGS